MATMFDNVCRTRPKAEAPAPRRWCDVGRQRAGYGRRGCGKLVSARRHHRVGDACDRFGFGPCHCCPGPPPGHGQDADTLCPTTANFAKPRPRCFVPTLGKTHGQDADCPTHLGRGWAVDQIAPKKGRIRKMLMISQCFDPTRPRREGEKWVDFFVKSAKLPGIRGKIASLCQLVQKSYEILGGAEIESGPYPASDSNSFGICGVAFLELGEPFDGFWRGWTFSSSSSG